MAAAKKHSREVRATLLYKGGEVLIVLGESRFHLHHSRLTVVFRTAFSAFLVDHGQAVLIAEGARAELQLEKGSLRVRLIPVEIESDRDLLRFVDCLPKEATLSLAVDLQNAEDWLLDSANLKSSQEELSPVVDAGIPFGKSA